MARYSHCSIFYSICFILWYFDGILRAEQLEKPHSNDLWKGNDSLDPINEKVGPMQSNKSGVEQLIAGSIKFIRPKPAMESRENDSTTRENNRWRQMNHTLDFWTNRTKIDNRMKKPRLKKLSRLLSIFKKRPDLFDLWKNSTIKFNSSQVESSSNCTADGEGRNCRKRRERLPTVCETVGCNATDFEALFYPTVVWMLSRPVIWAIAG